MRLTARSLPLGPLLLVPLLLTCATTIVRGAEAPDGDIADIPSQDLHAGENADMRYFLIGQPPADQKPAGLLLVLPGGDGSDAFHPFIKRIYKNAVPPGFMVAQLVATPINNNLNAIVWPTRQLKDPRQAFTTEDFIVAVMKDAKATHSLDERRIFLFAWSSGGPAAYAASVAPDVPVRGAFVAMSVFRPDWMPDPKGAAGRRYFILHSPDDLICPFWMAESARHTLKRGGATTELATYVGGHGWRGDVFDQIREGLQALDADPALKPATRPLPQSAATRE